MRNLEHVCKSKGKKKQNEEVKNTYSRTLRDKDQDPRKE